MLTDSSVLQELNEQSNKTWSANTSSRNYSSPTSSLTKNSRGAKRPSVFDAFDIERPNTSIAHKTVAKHKNIYDAFGVTDNLSTVTSRQSGGSTLHSQPRSTLSDTSPQNTWSAGMTRGSVPPELLQALRSQNKSPANQESTEAPPGIDAESSGAELHPADILSGGKARRKTPSSPFVPEPSEGGDVPNATDEVDDFTITAAMVSCTQALYSVIQGWGIAIDGEQARAFKIFHVIHPLFPPKSPTSSLPSLRSLSYSQRQVA